MYCRLWQGSPPLVRISLALHKESSEVRYRLQRREAGDRSQDDRYCSR